MVRLGLNSLILCIVLVISFSVKESKLEVASSKIISSGFLKRALAIASLCLSPPDNLIPPSPIFVSRPLSPLSIIAKTEASFKTSKQSLSLALGLTNNKFSLIVPANN